MSDIAVRVENLSKQYKIGAALRRHDSLRDHLTDWAKSLFTRNGRLPVQSAERLGLGGHPTSVDGRSDTIWALKDVSFEVKQGEVLGIIGRNGSGKSTLLKILSRITEPTSGLAEIHGRVGSLLEVGTGFHPELSGRENIYLNAAILGMKKAEIDHKLDEIIAFAEIEKFIDTPVKRYSSGMYVRLAFAVAAHMDPEILIVDEVLAVGDAAFQKKCLGKMDEVSKGGRTVLFVSHNMVAVENLCKNTLLIDGGKLIYHGGSQETSNYYLKTVLPSEIGGGSLSKRKDRSGSGALRLTSFHIEDMHGNKIPAARSGMDVTFVFGFRCPVAETPKNVDIGFWIQSTSNQMLFVLYSSYVGQTFGTLPASEGVFRCHIRQLPVAAGRYTVGVRIVIAGEEADWPKNGVGYLDVEAGNYYGTGNKGFGGGAPMLVRGNWEVRKDVAAQDLASGVEKVKREGEVTFSDDEHAPGSEFVRLLGARVRNNDRQIAASVDSHLPFTVEIDYRVLTGAPNLRVGLSLTAEDGTVLFGLHDIDGSGGNLERQTGVYRSSCTIPGNLLKVGKYSISVGSDFPKTKTHFFVDHAVLFRIEHRDGNIQDNQGGILHPKFPWEIRKVAEAD